MSESAGEFMRVERAGPDGRPRHYVVHLREPRFCLEMDPDGEAEDGVGDGLMKRLSVPNSWAGNYHHYAVLVARAREFFRRSLLEAPVKKALWSRSIR